MRFFKRLWNCIYFITNDISNDTEMMTRLAKGDMAALGDIVRKYQDKVLSLSYCVLGDWDRAEDIAQETFLRVYRAAKHYKPKARFMTWLYLPFCWGSGAAIFVPIVNNKSKCLAQEITYAHI